MKKLIIAAFLKCWSGSAFAADLLDARQILAEAEAIRNPKVSYEGTIKVTDERLGKIDERIFRVRSKNPATTIVEYLSPASEVGIKVLMLGDDMWVSMPRAAKPMRLAPRQKLVGNAAYGDVASISYADAYDAKLKGEEIIDGRSVYVLTLTAK
ncbi:MAG: outer membrane lipoprotein-sorting protein, partial [Proteobacteria bacterium]|nr:outer membrane lipoprotein-sorting protein [Pseudomonadota bacterium]